MEVGTADTDLLVFKGKNLQDYKVVELKRFLEERGLKKSGKKIELCERLRRYLVNEGFWMAQLDIADPIVIQPQVLKEHIKVEENFMRRSLLDYLTFLKSNVRPIEGSIRWKVKSFVILFNKHMKKRFIGKRMCLSCLWKGRKSVY